VARTRGGPRPVNLGNPEEFTIRELAELVIRLTNSARPSFIARCRWTIRANAARISSVPRQFWGGGQRPHSKLG